MADALSRRPDYELVLVTKLSSPVTDLIRAAYAKDNHCVALIHVFGSDEFIHSDLQLSARLHASLHRHSIDQGMLYYDSDEADPPRIVVPHDEVLSIASSMRRMTPLLVVILVVKRPVTWYARPIGGPNCISGSAHMCARVKRARGLNFRSIRRKPWKACLFPLVVGSSLLWTFCWPAERFAWQHKHCGLC